MNHSAKLEQLVQTVQGHGSHPNQISQPLNVTNHSLTYTLTSQHSFNPSAPTSMEDQAPKKNRCEVNYLECPYIELDFPRFTGKDPDYWVLQAERFCDFYVLPYENAIRMASLKFEGEALDWLMTRLQQWSWEEFKSALYAQFGSPEVKNPEISLCKLQQTGSVMEYRNKYCRIVKLIEGLPEKFLLKVFINGLKDEIRYDVMAAKPKDVGAACVLARDYERKVAEHEVLAKTLNPKIGRLMRVTGCLQGVQVSVLIGTASTHNFIHPSIVKKANCSTVPETHFCALMPAGEEIACENKCLNLPLVLSTHRFRCDYYVMKLWDCDIVLGAQWLKTLGDIKMNSERMEYVCDGVTHQLQWAIVDNSEDIDGSIMSVSGVFRA